MIIPTYRWADETGSGVAAVTGASASPASDSRGRRGSAQADRRDADRASQLLDRKEDAGGRADFVIAD
jgi:hypothetical protein